jgi:hypothetical protein
MADRMSSIGSTSQMSGPAQNAEHKANRCHSSELEETAIRILDVFTTKDTPLDVIQLDNVSVDAWH